MRAADVTDDVVPGSTRPPPDDGENDSMVLWPTVALVGFLLVTALVIAMGTHSTARYEAEKRVAPAPRPRHAAAPESARA